MPSSHTIHISLVRGQLNFVHDPLDITGNPNDGPSVGVDSGDDVSWISRGGKNFTVLFEKDSPFVGSTLVFGGAKNTPTPPAVVRTGLATGRKFKYFVAVSDPNNEVVTADPDIVIT
ncbi:MAG: hypothetical protein HY238_17935 [Acidobacteria bacterium]|nr:hypothetical protein [Acidobacteriota bacterium]